MNKQEKELRNLSDALGYEVKAARVVFIPSPMLGYALPIGLKLFINNERILDEYILAQVVCACGQDLNSRSMQLLVDGLKFE